MSVADVTAPDEVRDGAGPETSAPILIHSGVAGFSSEVKALVSGFRRSVPVVMAYPRMQAPRLQKRFKARRFVVTDNVNPGRRSGQRRSFVAFVRNVWRCRRRVKRIKPALGIFLGSAEALPMMIACRMSGVPCVFIETITRSDALSRTGLLVYRLRLAHHLLVQWPDLARKYRRAAYRGIVYDFCHGGVDLFRRTDRGGG